MLEEIQVLKDAVTRLDKAGIPYMLSGSMAMHFYSTPRMTRDLDFVIHLKEEGIPEFTAAFSGDYYLEENSIRQGLRTMAPFNLIHETSAVKIDFIPRKNTAYRLEEFSRKQKKRIHDFDVWVVAPEDLILSKMEWSWESGSSVQENDILSLLKALPGLDKDYIQKWSENLGLQESWRKFATR